MSKETWEAALTDKSRYEQMLKAMKDTVAEYSDEENGMLLMQYHLAEALRDLHEWHSKKELDLRLFIANLELMS